MDKNRLRVYLSMLWQGNLTPLKVLKSIKRNGFSFDKRDGKFLLSLLKDIEKHRLVINDEILEELIKVSQSCQKGVPC
mgnify:CR=1 FL=1